jgi:hypothetical protein
MTANRADQKARIAAGHASARRHPVPVVGELPASGWQLYKLGDVIVGMPKLQTTAPARVRRSYRDRLIANATGQCPRCEAIAGDPVEDAALAPFPHHQDCPVVRCDFEPWIQRAAA